MKFKNIFFVSLVITCAKCYPNPWSNPSLNPVHGLYVKPSGDGATGDLFVAATEDNGMKSQWAVDKAINFLPVAAATQSHAMPLPYPVFQTPIEESPTKKRAVMPSPVASSPVQYAYAVPVTSSEGNSMPSFPYLYPSPSGTSENSATNCDPSATGSQYPFPYPFQFFYPQMMSAYSNAMTILKDAGLNEDTASSVMAQTSPMWPSSPYTYPMYVMISPNACTQNHSSSATLSTSSSTQSEDGDTQN